MTRQQRMVLISGLVIAVAMFAYPPWQSRTFSFQGNAIGSSPCGYWPLWTGPTHVDPESPRGSLSVAACNRGDINYSRLVTQWLLLGLLVFGAFVLLASSRAAE